MKKFVKKWFFPTSFSFMFYPCLFALWFVAIPEWNRSWETFQNYLVFMVACFSVFYLVLDNEDDSEDGKFTEFHRWHESQKKWMKRLVEIILLILWFVVMFLAGHYFPIWNN